MKKLLILSGAVLLFAASCNTRPAAGENDRNDQQIEVQDEQNVPYTVAKRYFVKNTVGDFDTVRIADKAEFEKYFGMAAVMGKDGLPTTIDFEKQFVIPVVLPETNFDVEILPVSLKNNGRGELVFNYRVDTLREMSFTRRPLLLIVADKDYDTGKVVVEKD